MTRSAATLHVVERCPSCGVEHEASAGSTCEACDTPLRAWCRQHGRETGWLDGPSCSRCAEDAARAARPKPAPAPRLDVPLQAPAKAAAPAKPPPRPDRARPAPARAGGRRTVPLGADEPLLRLRGRVLKPVAVSALSTAAVGFAYGFGVEGEVTGLAGTFAIIFGLVGLVFGAGLGWGILVDARAGRPRPPRSTSRGVRT